MIVPDWILFSWFALAALSTAFEPDLARQLLEACSHACRLCREECGRHADHQANVSLPHRYPIGSTGLPPTRTSKWTWSPKQ
jgi:hypothetical protein